MLPLGPFPRLNCLTASNAYEMLPIVRSKSLRTVRLTRTWTCPHRRQRRLGVFHSDWSERRSGPSDAWQTNVTAKTERQALRKAEEASISCTNDELPTGVSLGSLWTTSSSGCVKSRNVVVDAVAALSPLDAVHRGDVCTLKGSPSRRLRPNGESHGRRPIGGERGLQR